MQRRRRAVIRKMLQLRRLANYGFDRNGYKVKKGVYADLKGTPYYFDKNGVRVAKKSSQLKKASKYMENGVKLRKLLGKPSKTRSYSSCMNGVSKDMKLTYANIYVSLGKKISGGEIIYGIQPRQNMQIAKMIFGAGFLD